MPNEPESPPTSMCLFVLAGAYELELTRYTKEYSLTLRQPFHIYIFATMASEISQRAVMDKVTSASGSKSHVK